MNIRKFFNPPKVNHRHALTASKKQNARDEIEESKCSTDAKRQKGTHQNLMNQLSEKPEFIIFLDIDDTIFKGFNSVCHSKEYIKLFEEYHQERGYNLPLIALTKGESLDDIDKAILKKAQETKVPIFIKTADNTFFIYGDRMGDGRWGFTAVVTQDDIDFSKLPFDRKEITRYDKLFNQALTNTLKQGHAQEKPFYAEYVYKGILDDYAGFKTQTHFFDELSLAHLTSLIDIVEKKGMKVGIVISSAWREFFDTEILKKLFCRLPFSKYIVDKIYDRACIYIDETNKSDLFLIELQGNKKLSWEKKHLAQEKNIPILIKENDTYSIYRCLDMEWGNVALEYLSSEEQKIINALSFNEQLIKSETLSNPLFEIIKKYHDKRPATQLNRAESIELFLKQNPHIFQFIILDDDYEHDLRELFPKNFVHCKNLYRENEYQLSLKMIDELLTHPKVISPQQIQNKVIPVVIKNFDENRYCNERLLEVSIRVLAKTRIGFLRNILREVKKSPFKDSYQITNLILEYQGEDFSESCPRIGK